MITCPGNGRGEQIWDIVLNVVRSVPMARVIVQYAAEKNLTYRAVRKDRIQGYYSKECCFCCRYASRSLRMLSVLLQMIEAL